jgi:O-antigen/teichoic acid export membrane protein
MALTLAGEWRFTKRGIQAAGLRLHPFLFDVLTTGLTQVAGLGTNFILVGVVSREMGVVVLGEYLLVRRISSWLLSGSQLGLGIALPRQVAHTVEQVETRARQYFLAAFATVLVFIALMGLVAALNADRLTRWCLGSENRLLTYALVLFVFGTAAHTMVFAYFRGLERMQMANLVGFGASVVVPLLALGVTHKARSAPLLIGTIGLGLAVVSMFLAIPKIAATQHVGQHFFSDSRQLLRYGVPRVPGDLAVGGLLTLGPMLVSHYVNIAQDSYLLLGITCLTMTGLAFAPVGMVLLARISRLLAAGRDHDVREYVGHLRSAVSQLSLVLVIQGLIFARPIVLWWLGPTCVAGVPVIRTVLLAVPAYMYFVAMRSVVDAASEVAHNARNVLIALAVLVALAAAVLRFVPPEKIVIGIAAATATAICVLAVATHRTLRILNLSGRPQFGPIWLAGLLGAISLTAQSAFHFEITKPAFCVVLLANVGLAWLLLRKSQPDWMGFLLRVAFART